MGYSLLPPPSLAFLVPLAPPGPSSSAFFHSHKLYPLVCPCAACAGERHRSHRAGQASPPRAPHQMPAAVKELVCAGQALEYKGYDPLLAAITGQTAPAEAQRRRFSRLRHTSSRRLSQATGPCVRGLVMHAPQDVKRVAAFRLRFPSPRAMP